MKVFVDQEENIPGSGARFYNVKKKVVDGQEDFLSGARREIFETSMT